MGSDFRSPHPFEVNFNSFVSKLTTNAINLRINEDRALLDEQVVQ